mgnify:CR=1 FL=1
MKKWTSGFVSFVLALTGAGALAPVPFAVAQTNQAQSLQNETQTSVGLADLASSTQIASSSQLGSLINSGATDAQKTFRLSGDIDCAGIATTIFNGYGAEKFFTGTFDGNGYTIKNLTLSSNNGFYGLFPYAKNATIKNLKIEGWSFDFENASTDDIVAGLLVGYGKDVRFENCELVLKDESGVQTILLGSYGENNAPQALNNNITFGLLAGYIDGNASLASNEANIKNCLVEGNVQLIQTDDKLANIGGLVGKLKNGFISHCIYNGKVEYSGQGSLAKKVGGIIGEAQGSNAKVRNVCFDGTVSVANLSSLSSGNIVGGKNASDYPTNDNFNYCYWTSLNGEGIGGESLIRPTFINTTALSKDFLLAEENFDDTLSPWNFDTVWSSKNGVIHLQNFMTFGLELNAQADVGGVFTAQIKGSNTKTVHKRYNDKVEFVLTTADEAKKDWYVFDGVLVNGTALSSDLYDVTNGASPYTITVQANALTEGTYSFRAKELKYSGLVETAVQDDETATDYGGVKIKGAISTSTSLSLDFSYASQTKNIEAVGKGKYIFAGWELYYLNEEGAWEKQDKKVSADNSKDISVTYTPSDSAKLYNRPFKIVALFSKNVKVVNFANYDKSQIKSLKINGEEFNGEGIEVAAGSTNVSLEIVTKNATMNADKFVQDFNKLHADNPLSLRDAPLVDEEAQEVIYTFTLDISLIDNAELDENNTLHLSITTQKARMGASKNMIWLYILLPVFLVACITAIIIIFVKKKRGGKGKRKTVKKTSDTKKVSYKDYYI